MNAHTVKNHAKAPCLPPGATTSPGAPRRTRKLRRIKPRKVEGKASPHPPVVEIKAEKSSAPPAALARAVGKPLSNAAHTSVTNVAMRSPAQPADVPAMPVPATPAHALTSEPSSDPKPDKQIALLTAKVEALIELMHRMDQRLAAHAKAASDAGTSADPERGLDVKNAAALLGISRASLYELRKEPGFVKPIQVGKRSVRYSRAELLAWQQAQKESKAVQ
jgi:predicted DNA-binding transcriptional regulator AlpA